MKLRFANEMRVAYGIHQERVVMLPMMDDFRKFLNIQHINTII